MTQKWYFPGYGNLPACGNFPGYGRPGLKCV